MSLITDSTTHAELYDSVRAVLVSELALDENLISSTKTLRELGAEPMDLIGVAYKLGIEPTKYLVDGHLNLKGRRDLLRMGAAHASVGNYNKREHYHQIAKAKSNEGLLELTVSDLIEISAAVTGVLNIPQKVKQKGEAA